MGEIHRENRGAGLSKFCFLDFEYNQTNRAKLNLVSVAWRIDKLEPKSVWLEGDAKALAHVKDIFTSLRDQGTIFVSYSVIAEGSSMIALGLDPTKMLWIDLQAEYKMLTNHNYKFRYGKQLINKKEIRTFCPSTKNSMAPIKAKKLRFDNPETSLAACTYKLLDIVIDAEHKDKMRDLIIAGGPFSKESKEAILKYGLSDIEYLPAIYKKIMKYYKECHVPITKDEILYRGTCVAHTALMTCRGYPVSKLIRNFSTAIPEMVKELCEDINSQFEDMKPFQWKRKELRFSMKEKAIKDWFKANEDITGWERTEKGDLSLSLDALRKHFGYRSPYPREILGAQIIRYKAFQQSLNGLKPIPANQSTRKTFYDMYGPDKRARAYLNPYGAQSSRFQPSATGFIPLKSNWMRWFIQPKKGKALAGLDYGSEEYFIAGLRSGDEAMLESYLSGDPYLYLGKKAKYIPSHGTKKSYGLERDLMKQTALGILFNMSCYGLAKDFTKKLGRAVTPEEAQKFIDMFHKSYPVFTKWMNRQYRDYKRKKYMKLLDGWVLFGDNPNERSVKNVPMQGMGAVILRKAIIKCHEVGLKPIMPLHDALYIEYDLGDIDSLSLFRKCMFDAFVDCFPDNDVAKNIRLDGYTWSKELEEGEIVVDGTTFKTMKYYLEDRGRSEFEKFSKYFIL